jgi:nitrite reductase (NADH) small subunit
VVESKLMVTADWLDIGPVDQLPALGARTLPVQGGDEIAVFRTANGRFYALVNKCPHKQGPLSQGIVHGTTVTCPLHNWRISARLRRGAGRRQGVCADHPGEDRRRAHPPARARKPCREWPEMSKAAIRTTCAYCGVGCGISAIGDRGALGRDQRRCDAPGQPGQAVLQGHASGRNGGARRAAAPPDDRRPARELGRRLPSWRNASGHHRRHGPDSVAFYVSGQLLTEDYYVANKLMKGFIGQRQHRHQFAPVHGQRRRGAQPRVRRGCRAVQL